jgi:Flp pilus assembly secretin CpaC
VQRLMLLIGIAVACASTVAHGEDAAIAPGEVAREGTQLQAESKSEAAQSTDTLDTSRQTLLRLRVVEVDVTVLRRAGLDFNLTTRHGVDTARMTQLKDVTDKLTATTPDAPGRSEGNFPLGSILPPNHAFFAFLGAVELQKLATELCYVNMTTEEGRPASYRKGTEFPAGQVDGKNVSAKFAGTSVEATTHLLPENRVRVDLAMSLSAVDESRSIKSGGVIKMPALQTREFKTQFETRLDETWFSSGAIQRRTVAAGKGAKAATSEHEFRQLLLVTPCSMGNSNVARQPKSPPR